MFCTRDCFLLYIQETKIQCLLKVCSARARHTCMCTLSLASGIAWVVPCTQTQHVQLEPGCIYTDILRSKLPASRDISKAKSQQSTQHVSLRHQKLNSRQMVK